MSKRTFGDSPDKASHIYQANQTYMKKTLSIAAVVLVVGLLGWGAAFYWQNLRGAAPAIESSEDDIADIIDRVNRATSTASNNSVPVNSTELPLKLPPNFKISIFARNLGEPRMMALDPSGNMLVSITRQGKVVALPDNNADGVTDETITVIDKLDNPHGLAFKCQGNAAVQTCKLYIAETNQLAVYDYDRANLKAINKKKLLDLPGGGNHSTRTIGFGPDERLYLSIGSSCNVCNEKDSRRAKIFSMKADGSDFKEVAKGLRNSVFFTWSQVDGRMWATEMGRDLIGDNIPPDEINIIEPGKNYGWPICYGKNIHDTDFDKNTYIRNPCMEPFETPSQVDLQAHSAPLGLAFVPEEGWPEEYWHNLIVAYHGSWNRTEPTGYKLARIKLDAKGNYLGTEDFISGWLTKDNEALGRPVDVMAFPGGLMYVTDDKAGVIYRINYQNPAGDKSNLIRVKNPRPNETVKSPLSVAGEARGTWFFEASFPVKIIDGNGQLLGQHFAQAQGDWMTENFVPFLSTLDFKTPTTATGTLVLEKDNPSGLPENADELRLPVRFEADKPVSQAPAAGKCFIGGCSNQVCSDKQAGGVITTCEFRPEYACYKGATCERQKDGNCGWAETLKLKQCLDQAAIIN